MKETKLKQIRERLQEKNRELDVNLSQEDWDFRRDYLSKWAEKKPEDLDDEGRKRLREVNRKYRQYLINKSKRAQISILIENMGETFGEDFRKTDLENKLKIKNGNSSLEDACDLPLKSPEILKVICKTSANLDLVKLARRAITYKDLENSFYEALESISEEIIKNEKGLDFYSARDSIDLAETQKRLVRDWRDFRFNYLRGLQKQEASPFEYSYKAELTEKGWSAYKEQKLKP